jgi:aldehyde dehydrogenase (NAD+)
MNDAVARGSRLLAGGSFNGRFYKPTVLANVTEEMLVFGS